MGPGPGPVVAQRGAAARPLVVYQHPVLGGRSEITLHHFQPPLSDETTVAQEISYVAELHQVGANSLPSQVLSWSVIR